MKKVLFSLGICANSSHLKKYSHIFKALLYTWIVSYGFLACAVSFAQEKTVKEAKKIANGTNPDFAKAEELINQALVNPETKDQAETWNVAGFIQKRRSEKEMENAYLRKPYDTIQVYNSALKMCEYFFKCDELAQIPNEKKLKTNTVNQILLLFWLSVEI